MLKSQTNPETPNSAKTVSIQQISQDLISWDDPRKYVSSLELMFETFFVL